MSITNYVEGISKSYLLVDVRSSAEIGLLLSPNQHFLGCDIWRLSACPCKPNRGGGPLLFVI